MGFLGMGSAGWSVTGLCLDALGFAILAWDLWPEYKIKSAIQLVEPIRALKSELDEDLVKKERLRKNYLKRSYRFGRIKLLRKPSEITSDMPFIFPGVTIAGLLSVISRPFPNRKKIWVSMWRAAILKNVDFDELLSKVDAELQEMYKQSLRRMRPPIGIGIVFILVGFLLQAWGSIPVPHEHPPLASETVVEQQAPADPASPPTVDHTSDT